MEWTDTNGVRCINLMDNILYNKDDEKNERIKIRRRLKRGLKRTKKQLIDEFRQDRNFHYFFTPDGALQVYISIRCLKCSRVSTIPRHWGSFTCPCCIHNIWVTEEDKIDYPFATPSFGPYLELLMEVGRQIYVEYRFSKSKKSI